MRNRFLSRHARRGAVGIALVTSSTVSAAVNFVAPSWQRPTSLAMATATKATVQQWDNFFDPAGPNVPDVANLNPAGLANAVDAFSLDPLLPYSTRVTSTGNFYNGSQPIRMRVSVPNFGDATAATTRFHLQIRTRGTELFDDDGSEPHVLDFSRLFIDGTRISSLPSFTHTPLYRLASGGTNSYMVERAIDFELPGNALGYTVEWTTPRGSCSQDEIAVDTIVVAPEPTVVFVAIGVAAVGAARRRRVRRID